MAIKKIYLSGPMRGYIGNNYELFRTEAQKLRDKGYEVINPADNFDGVANSHTRAEYMRLDIQHVLQVDAVVVMTGWETSKGAVLEVAVAREIGIPILTLNLEPYSETILQEAQRLVYGPRQKSYGHPINDFTRTGIMWGAILGSPPVSPEKVGLCMVAVKLSREVNSPNRDNRVDGAGYFTTVELIHEEKARQAGVW